MTTQFSIYILFIPGNEAPDWSAAGQRIEELNAKQIEDALDYFADLDEIVEGCKGKDRAQIAEEMFAELRNQLHRDLIDFRSAFKEAESSGGSLIVRKTMPDGQRMFAVGGFSEDGMPMHAYHWLVARLVATSVVQAAGFKLII